MFIDENFTFTWTLRYCDFTPIDFRFQGCLISKVYVFNSQILSDFKDAIRCQVEQSPLAMKCSLMLSNFCHKHIVMVRVEEVHAENLGNTIKYFAFCCFSVRIYCFNFYIQSVKRRQFLCYRYHSNANFVFFTIDITFRKKVDFGHFKISKSYLKFKC